MSSPPPPVDATAAEGAVPGEASATPGTNTYDETYNEGYTNEQNEVNESDYDNDDGNDDGDDGGFSLGSLFDSD
jgi:hypothetical protein